MIWRHKPTGAYTRQALIRDPFLVLKRHLKTLLPPALIQDRPLFITRRLNGTVCISPRQPVQKNMLAEKQDLFLTLQCENWLQQLCRLTICKFRWHTKFVSEIIDYRRTKTMISQKEE